MNILEKVVITGTIFLGMDAMGQVNHEKISEQKVYVSLNENHKKTNFIYVPSINLYVSKKISLHGKNWDECHRILQSQGNRMMTIIEYIEFLKHLESEPNNIEYQKVYEEMTGVRSPWRIEWLDASFKIIKGKRYLFYDHKFENGKLDPMKIEDFDKNTLMKNKNGNRRTRISYEDWIQNHTGQGLPTKNYEQGKFYYWAPRDNNNSVAQVGPGLWGSGIGFGADPSGKNSSLGVRAVRER